MGFTNFVIGFFFLAALVFAILFALTFKGVIFEKSCASTTCPTCQDPNCPPCNQPDCPVCSAPEPCPTQPDCPVSEPCPVQSPCPVFDPNTMCPVPSPCPTPEPCPVFDPNTMCPIPPPCPVFDPNTMCPAPTPCPVPAPCPVFDPATMCPAPVPCPVPCNFTLIPASQMTISTSTLLTTNPLPSTTLNTINPAGPFLTTAELNPWCLIDLGTTSLVSRITLVNRIGCCQTNMINAMVELLDQNNTVVDSYKITKSLYLYDIPFNNTMARYIRIKNTYTAYTQLGFPGIFIYTCA